MMLAQSYQHEKLSYLWFSLSLHKGNKWEPKMVFVCAHTCSSVSEETQSLCVRPISVSW